VSIRDLIEICAALAAVVGFFIKIFLRVEKRLTRIETKLGTEDEDTTVFIKKRSE